MLWCWDDRQGWGRQLLAAAALRGVKAALLAAEDRAHLVPDPGDLAFVHMHHHPETRARDKELVARLAGRGVRTIPDPVQARLYDDKIAQAEAYRDWMPWTAVLRTRAQAEAAIGSGRLGLPFVSKASEGASSHNVRLIETVGQAAAEVADAFGQFGIRMRYGQRQRGYLLWQRFLAGNGHDYRVIAVGRRRLVLRRFNRQDRPMASGSGRFEPVNGWSGPLGPEAEEAAYAAEAFFRAAGTRWCGIDLVRDPDRAPGPGSWRVLETTVGWTLSGYDECRFWWAGRWPSGEPLLSCGLATGRDLWGVLLDEIAAGALEPRVPEEDAA